MSTSYLNPKGLELYDLYSPLDIIELKDKCNELEIKYPEDISKDDCLILLIRNFIN